jgi:hypothetical protein
MDRIRRLLVGAAAVARRNPGALVDRMKQIRDLEARHDLELQGWAEPDEIGRPDGRKRFDATDLRFWIRLAEMADVPFVPAQEIARLDEEELGVLLGQINIPPSIRKTVTAGLAGATGALSEDEAIAMLDQVKALLDEQKGAGEALANRMQDALDDIPSSWMVRTHVCGSSNLKALVGVGLMHSADDTARVKADFEIGGGWIRIGNRRIIDFSDPRFVQLGIGGHKPETIYLARPWEAPGRWHEGEDIHRAGTPIAGPGRWPAEWRVFVRNGKVTGVTGFSRPFEADDCCP